MNRRSSSGVMLRLCAVGRVVLARNMLPSHPAAHTLRRGISHGLQSLPQLLELVSLSRKLLLHCVYLLRQGMQPHEQVVFLRVLLRIGEQVDVLGEELCG